MTGKKTFRSAFQNGVNAFVFSGVAYFVFVLLSLALGAWSVIESLLEGEASRLVLSLQNTLSLPLTILSLFAFLLSSFVFLQRVYVVRSFLIQRGVGQFPNWPQTIVSFGVPVLNFFVPRNRLDVVRETLRQYRETRRLDVVQKPEKRLRGVGIAWGILSLVSVGGPWTMLVLPVSFALLVLSFWTFVVATAWLAELERDFRALKNDGSQTPTP